MYNKLSFKTFIDLIEVRTFIASIIPVLVGTSYAYYKNIDLNIIYIFIFLLITILLQSSVNIFNDYFDFKRGLDSKENVSSSEQAVLVFRNINPKTVLSIGFIFYIISIILGLYLIIKTSVILLFLGVFGLIVGYLYSGGPKPISYTPFGEIFAGLTMGGIITWTSYFLQTKLIDFDIFYVSIPVIIMIGLILLVNNLCDIEKDIIGGRKTLPILITRKWATVLKYLFVFLAQAHVIYVTNFWLNSTHLYTIFISILSSILITVISVKDSKTSQTLDSRNLNMKYIILITIIMNLSYAVSMIIQSYGG